MRARYVAGESGIAISALVAEKSRVRNSLVQPFEKAQCRRTWQGQDLNHFREHYNHVGLGGYY